MKVYGSGNEERMTGEYETADFNKFSDGIANRGISFNYQLVPTGVYFYVLHLNDPQYPNQFIGNVYINY